LFTGLIEETGLIRDISSSGDGTALVIGADKVLSDLKTGDSIAVSGPCLTVTALGKSTFTAWAMPETLKKTNLNTLAAGHRVNLERAITLNDRLGGHLVSGHIDDVVILIGRKKQGGAFLLTFESNPDLLRFIVPKGSVALDGISLTVVEVGKNTFSVGLIPLTASVTTLGQREVGSVINLEVDIIGKYVEKMLKPHYNSNDNAKETITMSLLQEKGYL